MIIPETIKKECSQFLKESNHKPIIKYLPSAGESFRKVKLRKRNMDVDFVQEFNNAFPSYQGMMQRALICNMECPEPYYNYEQFYIYPVNNYKFKYARNSRNIKKTLAEMKDLTTPDNIVESMVEYIYVDDSLEEAIDNKYEIFFYNISYFYAIKKSLVNDYHNFIEPHK